MAAARMPFKQCIRLAAPFCERFSCNGGAWYVVSDTFIYKYNETERKNSLFVYIQHFWQFIQSVLNNIDLDALRGLGFSIFLIFVFFSQYLSDVDSHRGK